MPYVNRSQQARVSTESWVARNGYCLACDSETLHPTPPNTPARDFECEACGHPYELKSSAKTFGGRVVDGAYSSMLRRIETASVPTLLLLRYSLTDDPIDFLAVHRSLITPEIIQQRRPLAMTAKRAGWVGCNILLSAVPPEGRIPLIEAGVTVPRARSRALFAATEALSAMPLPSRRWSRALLNCLHRLPSPDFNLSQAYKFEAELSKLFPENHNIRPKIRQQLQVLRDAGLLSFQGGGSYRFIEPSHLTPL